VTLIAAARRWAVELGPSLRLSIRCHSSGPALVIFNTLLFNDCLEACRLPLLKLSLSLRLARLGVALRVLRIKLRLTLCLLCGGAVRLKCSAAVGARHCATEKLMTHAREATPIAVTISTAGLYRPS